MKTLSQRLRIIVRFEWLLILLSSSLFALPSLAADPAQSNTVPIRLQLKWKHQFQFAGYYAAKKLGYYREAGLDVTILEAPSNMEPAQLVLQGKAEFGIAASDLVLLRSQGYPVVALAAVFQHSPLVLLALQDRDISSIHDLADRRLMIEPHAAELFAYLKDEGIPLSRLTLLPHTFEPTALIRGEVDAISAYSTDEPFLLKSAGLDYLTFNPRSGGIDFYGDTLFTTETLIQKHPQVVRAFLDQSLRGWAYALNHPEEIIDLILSEYSQRHSREHLQFEAEGTARLILPDVVEIGYMNPGRWRHIADTYAMLKMAPANLSLDGFLYDRNPKPNLFWVYVIVGISLSGVGLVSAIAARFYQLNILIRREITERKRTESHLTALEKRYRILAENAPFPIIISRLENGSILYINAQAAHKFEIAQDYAIGKSTLQFYVNPPERTHFLTALERQGFVQNFELQLLAGSGSTFWANLSATVISFDDLPAIFVALIDITQRKELEIKLETLAITDELTGLFNRRYLIQRGQEEFQRARRYQLPLSFLMLDIDYFKQINDTYGHETGDVTLRHLAKILHQSTRSCDIIGRLGGEEFGIILTNTDAVQARDLAERIRQLTASESFGKVPQSFRVTVSIGVTTLSSITIDLDDLLRHADKALYQAKSEGRNRIVVG